MCGLLFTINCLNLQHIELKRLECLVKKWQLGRSEQKRLLEKSHADIIELDISRI